MRAERTIGPLETFQMLAGCGFVGEAGGCNVHANSNGKSMLLCQVYNCRNFYASSSVSFFIWLNICYLTDFRYIHSIMNISKLPLEYVVVLTSSVIFIVDYYLFYKSSLSILFQQSFNKCSLYYRTLIYSLALLIMAFPIICIELQ